MRPSVHATLEIARSRVHTRHARRGAPAAGIDLAAPQCVAMPSDDLRTGFDDAKEVNPGAVSCGVSSEEDYQATLACSRPRAMNPRYDPSAAH